MITYIRFAAQVANKSVEPKAFSGSKNGDARTTSCIGSHVHGDRTAVGEVELPRTAEAGLPIRYAGARRSRRVISQVKVKRRRTTRCRGCHACVEQFARRVKFRS